MEELTAFSFLNRDYPGNVGTVKYLIRRSPPKKFFAYHGSSLEALVKLIETGSLPTGRYEPNKIFLVKKSFPKSNIDKMLEEVNKIMKELNGNDAELFEKNNFKIEAPIDLAKAYASANAQTTRIFKRMRAQDSDFKLIYALRNIHLRDYDIRGVEEHTDFLNLLDHFGKKYAYVPKEEVEEVPKEEVPKKRKKKVADFRAAFNKDVLLNILIAFADQIAVKGVLFYLSNKIKEDFEVKTTEFSGSHYIDAPEGLSLTYIDKIELLSKYENNFFNDPIPTEGLNLTGRAKRFIQKSIDSQNQNYKHRNSSK